MRPFLSIYLHKSRENISNLKYDTIRCAFVEGEPIYPTANFSSRLHIQICVLNEELIRGSLKCRSGRFQSFAINQHSSSTWDSNFDHEWHEFDYVEETTEAKTATTSIEKFIERI